MSSLPNDHHQFQRKLHRTAQISAMKTASTISSRELRSEVARTCFAKYRDISVFTKAVAGQQSTDWSKQAVSSSQQSGTAVWYVDSMEAEGGRHRLALTPSDTTHGARQGDALVSPYQARVIAARYGDGTLSGLVNHGMGSISLPTPASTVDAVIELALFEGHRAAEIPSWVGATLGPPTMRALEVSAMHPERDCGNPQLVAHLMWNVWRQNTEASPLTHRIVWSGPNVDRQDLIVPLGRHLADRVPVDLVVRLRPSAPGRRLLPWRPQNPVDWAGLISWPDRETRVDAINRNTGYTSDPLGVDVARHHAFPLWDKRKFATLVLIQLGFLQEVE
jgi:hypothetical protein